MSVLNDWRPRVSAALLVTAVCMAISASASAQDENRWEYLGGASAGASVGLFGGTALCAALSDLNTGMCALMVGAPAGLLGYTIGFNVVGHNNETDTPGPNSYRTFGDYGTGALIGMGVGALGAIATCSVLDEGNMSGNVGLCSFFLASSGMLIGALIGVGVAGFTGEPGRPTTAQGLRAPMRNMSFSLSF